MTSAPKIKCVQNNKQADEFGVENVDNTAPVKKILDDVEQSNQKAYSFLNYTRRPRFNQACNANWHHVLPGLPLAAFPDDWEGDLSTDYFEPFPYKCVRPKFITPLANKHKQDPVGALLKLKHEWFSKYVCQKRSASYELSPFQISSKSVQPLQYEGVINFRTQTFAFILEVTYKIALLEKVSELNDEVVSCPKHFVDMAEHFANDPDPYFDSPSNWYYAGRGNMQLLYFNYTEYMLRSEFHQCYLYEFNRDELTFNSEAAAVFDCGEGNNIFESICSSQDVIALRTKHKIYVLKIILSDDVLRIEQLKVAESEMPFTSISFDEYHKNILYVTDLNNLLKIVNLDRLTARTVKLKNSVKSLVNNWTTVIGNERPYFTHVARNSINLYDKRINGVIHTWQSPNDVSDEATCNHISAAEYSSGSPYLYFGTNHHLFLMDLRYQTNSNLKLLQRWTHGMQCYPTYMSICNFEFNKELVCLSSQWCEDTCVVPNYIQSLKDAEFSGISMPYRPPSVLATLNEARLQALCHDVYKTAEQRLVTALTGCLVLEQGDKYIVLCQNGLGDITSLMLYPEHMDMFVEDDSAQALHEWSQDCEPDTKDFEVSFVRDISNIWKKLKKLPAGALNEKFTDEPKFNEQEIYDMFENEELDEGLLDVWVNKQDETNIDDQSLRLSLDITKE